MDALDAPNHPSWALRGVARRPRGDDSAATPSGVGAMSPPGKPGPGPGHGERMSIVMLMGAVGADGVGGIIRGAKALPPPPLPLLALIPGFCCSSCGGGRCTGSDWTRLTNVAGFCDDDDDDIGFWRPWHCS